MYTLIAKMIHANAIRIHAPALYSMGLGFLIALYLSGKLIALIGSTHVERCTYFAKF